jgi:hypothetical protein
MATITISWLAPFYQTLTEGGLGVPMGNIILGLAAIVGASYLADLLVDFLRLRTDVRIVVQIGVLIVSGSMALNLIVWAAPGYGTASARSFIVMPEVVGIVAILIAWWRGQSLSQHQSSTIKIRQAFRFGILLHLFTGFIIYQVSGELNPMPFYLFLFASLTGMGCARLGTVGSLRGGKGIPFDRGLVAGIGGTAGGLILVSSVIAVWAGGPLAGFIRRILGGGMSVLVEVVFFILQPIIRWIIGLLEMLGGSEAGLLPEDDTFNPDQMGDTIQQVLAELNEEIIPPAWAADLGQIIKVSLIVIGTLVLLALIYAGLRQWRSFGRLVIRNESESLISLSDLPGLLQKAIRDRVQAVVQGFQKLRPDERRYAAARIRRIYAELMALSQRLDMARPRASTPLEFLPNLMVLFESEDEALELITRAYLKIRYGELPETRHQVDEVELAWQRVEARGRYLYRQTHGRLGLG